MSTSIVHPTASLGTGTRHGEFCLFGEGVKIGNGCVIGHHVIIHDQTVIGDNVRIDDGTVIGKRPMKAANSATTSDDELDPCRIDSNGIIFNNKKWRIKSERRQSVCNDYSIFLYGSREKSLHSDFDRHTPVKPCEIPQDHN